MAKLLHEDLSYKIRGVLFAVHNELGRFAREKQYSDCFEQKLKESQIIYQRELAIGDSGNVIDFLVDNVLIVEFKAKPFLLKDDYFQVQRYLHATNLELGILVNFRASHLVPKRVLRAYHQ